MNDDKKITILIVEDDKTISKVYADELIDSGFDVLVAFDGLSGLNIATEKKPDLILLDILMPEMDGLVMMDKIRNVGLYGKKVPIILLTNLSAGEEKIMQAIIKNEPAYYIVKSDWNLVDVVEKINERLSRV